MEANQANRKPEKTKYQFQPSAMIVSGLFLQMALYVWYLIVIGTWNLLKVQTWEPTACVIQKMDVECSGTQRSKSCRPLIEYTYQYGGQNYQGSRFDAVGSTYPVYAAQWVRTGYPVNSLVDCYVNPANPQEAVVSRSFNQLPLYSYGVLIAILTGFASIFLFVGRKITKPLVSIPPQ